MCMILKRDGRKVPVNRQKIVLATLKAFQNTPDITFDNDKVISLAESIADSIDFTREELYVEQIQDRVIDALKNNGYPEVAESYSNYRRKRTIRRERGSSLMKEIGEKVTASNVVNQNANVDEHSFGGRRGEANSSLMKYYALNNVMSKKAKYNHIDNLVYTHDLDYVPVGAHNCLSVPFDSLLRNGFNTRQADVRPANSINTAMQLVAVLFQLQSLQQFGGVSATHLDWSMIPYIRKSLMKHYIANYLKFSHEFMYIDILSMVMNTYEDEAGVVRCEFDDWVDDHKQDFFNDTGLTAEDFFIGSEKLDKKLYNQALFDTVIETQQAAEGMYHNLNTLQSRSGNQLPFTSINYGTCTIPEGRLMTHALLMGSIKGVGKLHKTPIFPCGIFQCMKGINRKEGEPNYDLYRLALKSTARRLYPNYVNCDVPMQKDWVKFDRDNRRKIVTELSDERKANLIKQITEDESLKDILLLDVVDGELVVIEEELPIEIASTMGCRTVNGADINAVDSIKKNIENIADGKDPYDNVISAAQKDGRGNVCPVTIILPTLAMEAKNSNPDNVIDEFMDKLDYYIHDAKDQLIERFDHICSQNPASAKFMYENNAMSGYVESEGVRSAMRHGTIVIGQLGLAECLQILIGCDHTDPKGMELAKRIEQLFKDRCAEFKQRYKLNFGVYYTPAESLCFTAMNKFKEKYGEIPNVSDREYFTNSMHVPVWKEIDPFTKIDIESELVGYHSAGAITYIELDTAAQHNIDAIDKLVQYAMDKNIPYFAINVPNDTCLECGHTGLLNDTCPVCGSDNIQRLRRVTGYITGNYTTAFNLGKQAEVRDRFKHTTLMNLGDC